jgi:hypothetical protein
MGQGATKFTHPFTIMLYFLDKNSISQTTHNHNNNQTNSKPQPNTKNQPTTNPKKSTHTKKPTTTTKEKQP